MLVIMGPARRPRPRPCELSRRTGERDRRGQGAALSAVLGGRLHRRAARHRSSPSPCWTARRSRAAIGEPLYPRRRGRARGNASWRTRAMDADPKVDRRTLRAGLKGVHARDGQGGLRRTGQAAAEAALHGRHQRRCDAAVVAGRPGPSIWTALRPTSCGPCSSASARTERSAPTRTRSRSSARRPTTSRRAIFVYDSKKSGAMTISHLRFGPRPIRAPYLITPGRVRRVPSVRHPRQVRRARPPPSRAPCSCSTPRSDRTRSGTSCRRTCRPRSSNGGCASS